MKFLTFVLLALFATPAFAADVVKNLQDASVTVHAVSSFGQGSQGSGVTVARDISGEHCTFVWTAGHVVDSLRKTRKVVSNGISRTVVEFGDAQIVQEFRENGRRIGEIKMDCRVIRYSDSEQGEDLALLEVRKRDFSQASVSFFDGPIPSLGTKLYHVGSLRGQFGANSLTTGIVSQIGRVLDLGANGKVFDQTTTTAFPGSSGGGVFLQESGEYIGMLVRGSGEQFNFIVPIRRIRKWAESVDVLWALDPSVPAPTREKLNILPIEDTGVAFDSIPSSDAQKYGPYLQYFTPIELEQTCD